MIEAMKDPQLLGSLGLGEKLLGSVIVMILGLAVCMIVLGIIMLSIKLLRFAGAGREKETAAGLGSSRNSEKSSGQ